MSKELDKNLSDVRTHTSLREVALKEPLDYDRLLDISTDELDFLKNEADSVMLELRTQIIREYEKIKPSLNQMRIWKQQLKLLQEKREVYKTFLSLERNDTLLSSNSSLGLGALRKPDIKKVSFGELFSELEKEEEGQPVPQNGTRNCSEATSLCEVRFGPGAKSNQEDPPEIGSICPQGQVVPSEAGLNVFGWKVNLAKRGRNSSLDEFKLGKSPSKGGASNSNTSNPSKASTASKPIKISKSAGRRSSLFTSKIPISDLGKTSNMVVLAKK
jgi:hypothetical protein